MNGVLCFTMSVVRGASHGMPMATHGPEKKIIGQTVSKSKDTDDEYDDDDDFKDIPSALAGLARWPAWRASKDALFRQEAELQRGVEQERRKVRELEMSRKAQQELEAERLSLSDGVRARETLAFTISTGRQELRRDRLEGCKRACVVS